MELITKAECTHCLDVKRIFSDFIESQTDFCVVDAYPFGYFQWMITNGTDGSFPALNEK